MSKINLKNITEIMKRDFKASFSNPIVTIVLVAIIILPSLYALLNIYNKDVHHKLNNSVYMFVYV